MLKIKEDKIPEEILEQEMEILDFLEEAESNPETKKREIGRKNF